MAESNAFKQLEDKDRVSTRTLLHEAIPLTGTILSGTYSDTNINNPPHAMFQSVYDYSYLSSSANHIFDITVGVSTASALYPDVTTAGQQAKKKNIYNQMSQVLVGYDATGSVLHFDKDGDLTGGDKYEDVLIIPFSRLLVKDEIKKGTFSMTLGVATAYATPFTSTIDITDASGSDQYYVNSPVGEYGILYGSGSAMAAGEIAAVGLLYYQAGIAVLTKDVFSGSLLSQDVDMDGNTVYINDLLTGSTNTVIADSLRHRTQNIQFNNTTELNSTIYFCRANHNEFNYSTNPSYVDGSKIRVKTNSTDEPISYITSIGLYNDKNELMATAKLSEPLRKSPSTEFTLRARLDY
jgi:hypothetical protein